MPAKPIVALPLEFDQDGLPYSSLYGDVYASRSGALQQALHVFLSGNNLPHNWAGRTQFVILETGFGLGTNFLATWRAWQQDPQRPRHLHFVSLEKHPIRAQDMQALAKADPDLLDLRLALAQQWPLPSAGTHRLHFESGRVTLTLILGDVSDALSSLVAGVDAFYLDGFSPDRNPEMWQAAVYRKLASLARDQATLATYTSAGHVRDGLAQAGFMVERIRGFANKRHMLRGVYLTGTRRRRREPPGTYHGLRDAIVVGSGLAGCATAMSLAKRGWHVRVLESGPRATAGASGLPCGLLHPWLSRDDNASSRLSRAGFLFARRQLLELTASAEPGLPIWAPCGVLHLSESEQEFSELSKLLQQMALPADLAQPLDATSSAARVGMETAASGIWFPGGAIVSAQRWCQAMLASSTQITVLPQHHVTSVQATQGGQQVTLQDGQVLDCRLLVLANASDLTRLAPLTATRTDKLPGRISLLSSDSLPGLQAGLSGEGYAIPGLLGMSAVGGTYELNSDAPNTELAMAQAHAQNLERLASMLPNCANARAVGEFYGIRCASQDRLPLAGAWPKLDRQEALRLARHGAHLNDLPRDRSLSGLAALGSRGLTLACILADLLASQIEGEPCALPRDLIDAVDPARFALRQWRQETNA